MANSIALAQKYLPVIDEVYTTESRTAILDAANDEINWLNAHTAEILNVTLPGLGDYSRANGYPRGDINSTWETMEITKERGIELGLDRMDSEETFELFAKVAGMFYREKVAPELDAYRFAKYAASAGTTATGNITVGTTDVPALIDAALAEMGDAGVPDNGIIFISYNAYNGLQNKITRYLANETEVNREVELYNGHRVIKVPQIRMNTLVTLYNGSTNFGFVPTAGGYKINFMIIQPDAVKNAIKLDMPKIFTADENQTKDENIFQTRLYHDAFVLANKTKGVYLHRGTTANA